MNHKFRKDSSELNGGPTAAQTISKKVRRNSCDQPLYPRWPISSINMAVPRKYSSLSLITEDSTLHTDAKDASHLDSKKCQSKRYPNAAVRRICG